MTGRTTFFILAATTCSMFFSYVFLVNKTVSNVVARSKTESSISELSSSMGDLEFKYMALKKSVTLDLAYSKGFEDAMPSTFLAQKPMPAAISYNSR